MDRLFRIKVSHQGEEKGEHRFTVELDPEHEIFEGHFPGEPVLPGVCMMEMGQELLAHLLERELILQEAKNMKFTAMVDPRKTPELDVVLRHREEDEDMYGMDATVTAGATTFFKFKGRFKAS